MAAITAKRKQEIAEQLKVASTWVGGKRSTILSELAAEIAGETVEDAAPVTE
jgi:PP-loop superfamily ATP-utilizing enzyme